MYHGDMYAILFQLAVTHALLWYQRQLKYRLRAPVLTLAWEAVNVALALIQSIILTGTWRSGTFMQSAVVGLFYLPAVFFTYYLARQRQLTLWKSFGMFLGFAFVTTFVAAALLAYIPAVQGLTT
jgi:hypothetical protein